MIKSMTGYGKDEATVSNRKITVEIRSLNSKQLDLSIKLPAAYRPFEYDIRALTQQRMLRGKADMFISVELTEGQTAVTIDPQAFGAHYRAMTEICRSNGIAISDPTVNAALVQSIMRMPDVVSSDQSEISEQEQQALMQCVTEALDRLDAFRIQEGRTLIADMLNRVDKIKASISEIEPFESSRIDTIRARILDGLASIGVEANDNSRLEQEMIFYLEKLDITEEKVRLANHCKYFHEVAEGEEAPGRKLGFIAQEMGREINTLGSKANNCDIQRIVVHMKDELEKIKEQVLNLL